MYKKKLDDLKPIKQKLKQMELERDTLREEVEQERASKNSNKKNAQIAEFYKKEIEESRGKIIDFEDALKAKNNEIVKFKNQVSKLEREHKLKDGKIESLEAQLEEYLDKTDESVDEYKDRITLLEKQIDLLKSGGGEDNIKDKILMLEESSTRKDLELQKSQERIQKLQEFNQELEEEMDNLRNELSTLSDGTKTNGEIHRASVEGIKRNQIERDLRKSTQEKIKLESELQVTKDKVRELEGIKEERDQLRDQVQDLFNQKNDLQEQLYSIKEERLAIQTK